MTRLHLLAKEFCSFGELLNNHLMCATCISWKYWCRCPGLCYGGAKLDRALVGWKRKQKANGNQGDPQGSSAWQSAARVKGQTKILEQSLSFVLQKKKLNKKNMQMHKMFPRVFISPNFACWCCVIAAADNVGHALIKAGCRPAQDAILQGDRKPFRVDINHS